MSRFALASLYSLAFTSLFRETLSRPKFPDCAIPSARGQRPPDVLKWKGILIEWYWDGNWSGVVGETAKSKAPIQGSGKRQDKCTEACDTAYFSHKELYITITIFH